jgi:tripartite-type tricarboxylate transporter receptor subunit TctC
MIRILLACLAAGVLLLQPIPAGSQAYPERPIHIVVTFPPGGNADTMARLVADKLAQAVGQPVVVENKPGGATIVGTNAVVQAPADGYTLLQASTSLNTNPDLGQKTPYDAERDLLPVINLVTIPAVLVINPALPANNLAEFIAYAKTRPKEINYGSAGNGSFPHLAMEQLSQAADIKMTHVPFRGFGPAMIGLLRNDISALASDIPGALEHIRAGKLRALGVTVATRVPVLPDVPTVGDAVPGYEASGFLGFGAPKSTPVEIVGTLNREINAALADPAINGRLTGLGATVLRLSPDDFGKLIAAETDKWTKVVKFAGIKPE